MEYDEIVENLYLSAINDRQTHAMCLAMVKKELQGLDRFRIGVNLSRTIARVAGYVYPVNCSAKQINKAWQLIRDDLIEPALAELKQEISTHISNGQRIQAEVETKINQTLEDTKLMNDLNQLAQNLQSSPLTSVEFVYGKPINELTANDCLTLIKKANDDIANFKAFGVESTYITGEIAKIEMAKKKLAERLDTFTDPKSVVEVVGQK